MSDRHDIRLETLFAQAEVPLEDDDIAARVMAAARKRKYLFWFGGAAAALLALLASWLLLAIPLLEFAILVSELLTTGLVDLGDGWLALILLPVNSVAGLLALTARAAQLIRRRMIGSFA